jgi:hypothetical protein
MTSPNQPYPQPAPYAPRAIVPLAQPDSVQRAVLLIYAGSVFAVVGGAVGVMAALGSTSFSFGSTTSSSGVSVPQALLMIVAISSAAIQCALWVWMAWKTGAGRQWARVVSTVFFGITSAGLVASTVFLGLSGLLDARQVPSLLVSVAEFGVGLAAIILLYRPESSEYFAITQQARYADMYARTQQAAAYPGGPVPGYGPPSNYGQPTQYSQPSPHGQAPQPPH